MPDIVIQTVADIKRAAGLPGAVLLIDRHDRLAQRIVRDASMMRKLSTPRTVSAIKSRTMTLQQEAGASIFDFPSSDALIVYGNNTFSIREIGKDGALTNDVRTYRIEVPGTLGFLTESRLPINHPPLPAAVVQAELDRKAEAEADADLALQRARAEWARISALPQAPQDPRIEDFDSRVRVAVKEVLLRGPISDEELAAQIYSSVAVFDFWSLRRLPEHHLLDDSGNYVQDMDRNNALEILKHNMGFESRGTVVRVIWRSPTTASVYISDFVSTGRGGPAREVNPGEQRTKGDAWLHAFVSKREFHSLRRHVEFEIRDEANQEALLTVKPFVGQVFKNIRMKGHLYSTVTVTKVNEPPGEVQIEATKRGSRYTYKGDLPGTVFARVFYPEPKKPDPVTIINRRPSVGIGV